LFSPGLLSVISLNSELNPISQIFIAGIIDKLAAFGKQNPAPDDTISE
jgi:hypothetical protein